MKIAMEVRSVLKWMRPYRSNRGRATETWANVACQPVLGWRRTIGSSRPGAALLSRGMTRIRSAAGRSGGRRGGKSTNCTPHPLPRGSSRHESVTTVQMEI
jgi:hypothetical protein